MDNLSDFGSLCPSSRREWEASRNKSEKKRRDQFNVLIKELCTMLQGQGHPRKMDKSTILQRTINFLQKQKEITSQTESCENRQDWKPSFLSNEEFTQLMLEALDGFLIAITTDGNIIYVSDSVSSLTGHLPSDMVDQNILNFLPECEHGEVYKLLSSHIMMSDPVSANFLENETRIEFCCHLARGNMNPKEPPTYEYVKFVGDFKFHNNVPTSFCNGYDLTLPRTLQSSLEEQVCLVATVRLVTPQFLKDLCNIEDPCDEFTSRHSLEWKFLFLDHRASPIIGYLPFEVLGTSGYDYYHVDDLELIAQCHKQLMQFGKGKSCYYRFLTKGQQWIWLQTHYYITYHQWNSKPEFIVCTHIVVSFFRCHYLILYYVLQTPDVYLDICPSLDPPAGDQISRACSVSSQSSRKSSHTALSDSACVKRLMNSHCAFFQSQQQQQQQPQQSMYQEPQPPAPHMGVMHQLKEQLEERTRILQMDIKTQQQELHDIKEKLQLANLQMLLQQPIHSDFSQQQAQSGVIRQASNHSKQPLHGGRGSSPHSVLREHSKPSPQVQQRLVRSAGGQIQTVSFPVQTQTSLNTPFYSNPMMFSQQTNAHMTETFLCGRMLLNQPMQTLIPDCSVSSQTFQCNTAIQQTKYTLDQQMMTPSFPMQQVNCNAVLVPSPVFTSPIMIPHNSFITPQPQPTYHAQQQASQHSLQLQQSHQFFQMQPQGLLHSGPTQAFFQTTNIPQQGTVGYIQQPQPQQQQRQHHHSHNQTGSLSDFRNMLTR
uniref:Neuronal PAS domain protein 2 n=1 Tax=Esox lucius TaxID=8010 RepID=A0A6Q2ZJX2_ESOLU